MHTYYKFYNSANVIKLSFFTGWSKNNSDFPREIFIKKHFTISSSEIKLVQQLNKMRTTVTKFQRELRHVKPTPECEYNTYHL